MPTISTSLSEEAILISSLIWALLKDILSLARNPGSKWPTDEENANTAKCLTTYMTQKSAEKGISQVKKKPTWNTANGCFLD